MRILRLVAIVVTIFSAFAFFNNSNWFASPRSGKPVLLAHRGLAQTFSLEGVKADTCTATRIHPPEHPYLENSIASMKAAFSLGADIVELDVHPTTDGHFVVFHDWTLDCRTDGTGVTRDHSLAELKALDIGYGYTADGGKTFPFRGKGVGLTPSLDEVLDTFPDRRLLIHVKSDDPAEGERLAQRLGRLAPDRLERLIVYGGGRSIRAIGEHLPELRTMSRQSLTQCLLRYFAFGWTGYVPTHCRNSMILVPINYVHWLWGWPTRFIGRMRSASSSVFVVGPWDGGEFSRGIDDEKTFRSVPPYFNGGIWTNRVDRIAPLAHTAAE